MIFSVLILFVIIYNVYRGYRFGLIRVASYLLSFLVALNLEQPVSRFFNLPIQIHWLVFLVLFIIVQSVLNSLSFYLERLTDLPIPYQFNRIGGMIFGGVFGYLLALICVDVLLILPSPFLHQQYSQSTFSQAVIRRTPGIVHHSLDYWIK